MSARRPLIVGNWKMHETIAESRSLMHALRSHALPGDVDVAVAPPFTALTAVAGELRGSSIALAAQTMHECDSGPFTGEISPVMLQEIGVAYVILGHSERRAACGESDEAIARKVRAALAHDLIPIVAVGETHDEHIAGRTLQKVTTQTQRAFEGLGAGDVARCVVAYEPIWAIGSGLSEDPASAAAVMGEIRACVDGFAAARILYGGSMKAENAAALLAQPNIDGGLIGGASLCAESFAAIVGCARLRAEA